MEEKLIEQFERFKDRVGDPVAAAILTLVVSLATDKGKRTGLTTQDAAQVLGVHPNTVKALCNDGRLNPIRIGRAVRFNMDDLESFQKRKRPTCKT